jgi:protein-tyrosine-phosphatase
VTSVLSSLFAFLCPLQILRYNSFVPQPKLFRVLFLCLGNACRSPIAESIARRDAPDILDPFSAGLYPLGYIPPATLQALHSNGYPSDALSSKPISRDTWESADLIINLTGARTDPIFNHSDKVEDWDVLDPFGGTPEVYQNTLEDIAARVHDLADRLRLQRTTSHAEKG